MAQIIIIARHSSREDGEFMGKGRQQLNELSSFVKTLAEGRGIETLRVWNLPDSGTHVVGCGEIVARSLGVSRQESKCRGYVAPEEGLGVVLLSSGYMAGFLMFAVDTWSGDEDEADRFMAAFWEKGEQEAVPIVIDFSSKIYYEG